MKSSHKTLLLWGVLILTLLGIWKALAPPGDPTVQEDASWWSGFALPSVVVALGVLALAFKLLVGAARGHNAAIRAANAHMTARRFDEAERAIEGLAKSKLPQFPRSYHVMRAQIAMAQGDAEGAIAAVEPAISAPLAPILRYAQRAAVLQALTIRAFARACLGDEKGVREDIDVVRAEPDVSPFLLAQASLAEVRLFDQKGDRSKLGAVVARDRFVLLHGSSKWTTALVRAYEAMLDASSASVYREKPEHLPANDAETNAIAAWVATVAPNAAPFVRPSAPVGLTGDVHAEAPSAAARRKIAATRPTTAEKASAKQLGIWFAAIGVFLGVYRVATDAAPGSQVVKDLVVVAGFAVVIAWIARAVRRQQRITKRINRVHRSLAIGEEPTDDLASMKDASPTQRAQIANVQAELAMRNGDVTAALARCDEALLELARTQGGKLAPPVAPAEGTTATWDLARVIAAQRAFALAALGRSDEAWAEIEWANGLPSTLPIFRVLLLARVHAGDFEGAARAAEARDPNVTLPIRDETMAEMARFVGHPATRTAAGAAKLRAELRRDPGLGAWLDALAKGLLPAFEIASAESDSSMGETPHAPAQG